MKQESTHIENLQSQFGTIHIQIRHQNEKFREIGLIDQNDILRTLAISKLNKEVLIEEYYAMHEDIKKGVAISIALKKHNIDFNKSVESNFMIHIPKKLGLEFNNSSSLTSGQYSKIFICYDNKKSLYAEILEIFHPLFKTNKTLHETGNAHVFKELIEKFNLVNYLIIN